MDFDPAVVFAIVTGVLTFFGVSLFILELHWRHKVERRLDALEARGQTAGPGVEVSNERR